MSVKRYVLEDSEHDVAAYMADADAERDAHTEQYVLATDFDALAKRLEEAERLLQAVRVHTEVGGCACGRAIDAFLENRT